MADISVLILDDDALLLDMYSTKFLKDGFIVHAFSNGLEAIEFLKEKQKEHHKIDVVVSDLIMPQMDGFQFLETVRGEKLAEDAKLVILSNKNESDDILRAEKLGIAKYLVKANLIPSDVVREVRAVLEK